MREPDLDLLIDAARAAGDIATQFTGKTARKWEKPDGAGPVTEADLAVNAMLEDRLRGARPDYGWLSEETEDDPARLTRDMVFIIDPIDGTRSFVEGTRTWAHSLAVAHKGEVVAGVVYLPLRDMLYAAAKGQGATLNGTPLSGSDKTDLRQAQILSARPNLNAKHWRGAVPPFGRAYRPSLAYRMALVAQGRFDGMLTLRPTWEWDIAAGQIIQAEAGVVSSDRQGQRLRFNSPNAQLNGIVAAGAPVHAQIIDALVTD